jgi:hypothetical protein
MLKRLFLLGIVVGIMRLDAQPIMVNSNAPGSLRIQYTGRLFGYYRMEPDEKEGQYLGPVEKFLNMRKVPANENLRPLLLGMGDNFAPEMGASLQRVGDKNDQHCYLPEDEKPPSAKSWHPPQSIYKTSSRSAPSAECDNVVKFLLEAGYRAIVPGREDFGYSAAWLHNIGVLVRRTNLPDSPVRSRNRDKKLTILAANIRVDFKAAEVKVNSKAAKPKSIKLGCPLLLADNLADLHNETCSNQDLPTRLDWLERVDRVLARPGVAEEVETAAEPTSGTYNLLRNETLAIESMLPSTGRNWSSFKKTLTNLAEQDQKLMRLTSPAQLTGSNYGTQLCLATAMAQVLYSTLLNTSAQPECDKQKFAAEHWASELNSISGELKEACDRIRTSIKDQEGDKRDQMTRDADICEYGKAVARAHRVDVRKNEHAGTLSEKALRAGQDALLRMIAEEELDKGYTEATVEENGHPKSILIIGVAGQETMAPISLTNRQVCLQQQRDESDQSEHLVGCDTTGRIQGNVTVMNPIRIINALLRGAKLIHRCEENKSPCEYDYRVLMAQMPQTEAIELVARLNAAPGECTPGVESACGSTEEVPQLDLVLSEAQSGHETPYLTAQYRQDMHQRWSITPVLTPTPAYDIQFHQLVRPDSILTLAKQGEERNLKNEIPTRLDWDSGQGDSALHLLMVAVENAADSVKAIKGTKAAERKQDYFIAPRGQGDKEPEILHSGNCTLYSTTPLGTTPKQRAAAHRLDDRCKVSVIQYLLRHIQEAAGSDLAVLQRRDIFLERLPLGYDKYEVCKPLDDSQRPHCELRMALDRVLWKGDYSEIVMLSGKDIAGMMLTASTQNSQEQSLSQTDISGQWLVTFGIVTVPASNLTRSQISSSEFSVTSDPSCNDVQERVHPSAGGRTLYCVNGQPLLPDHAYSIATTDYLDQTGVVPKQPFDDYYSSNDKFVTEILEQNIFLGQPMISVSSSKKTMLDDQIGLLEKTEVKHQQRRLFQFDIAKVVGGYNFRSPQSGDNFVASAFQGATDSRASSPSQSELDVEAKERALWRTTPFNFGIQSDAAYDRSVQGNLTGAPVNAAYPLNNATVGGFVEWKITSRTGHHAQSPAGVLKAVLAPYQYQRQFNGSYLFFAHTDKTKNEQTLHLSPVNGFSHKAGLRWSEEVSLGKWFRGDRGSYFEAGPQLTVLNDILADVTLTTPGSAPLLCPANSSLTILNCFKAANYPINAATMAVAQTATLHSSGLYWDMHYQKALKSLADKSGPGISLGIDSKGDYFFRRSARKTLSSQTLYDVPASVSLGFPVLRNFSVGPTYSVFLYGNQVAAQSLVVNSFGLTGRWYFDRDAAVDLGRQGRFKGPASADETKTSRIK